VVVVMGVLALALLEVVTPPLPVECDPPQPAMLITTADAATVNHSRVQTTLALWIVPVPIVA
jgi:hypothetical protein